MLLAIFFLFLFNFDLFLYVNIIYYYIILIFIFFSTSTFDIFNNKVNYKFVDFKLMFFSNKYLIRTLLKYFYKNIFFNKYLIIFYNSFFK